MHRVVSKLDSVSLSDPIRKTYRHPHCPRLWRRRTDSRTRRREDGLATRRASTRPLPDVYGHSRWAPARLHGQADGDWTKKVVVRVGLEQDGAEANRRSVSHDQVFGVGPKGLQNRSRRNCGSVKTCVTLPV